jgi:hypothetical protein
MYNFNDSIPQPHTTRKLSRHIKLEPIKAKTNLIVRL